MELLFYPFCSQVNFILNSLQYVLLFSYIAQTNAIIQTNILKYIIYENP
jgi:hypothetical protein